MSEVVCVFGFTLYINIHIVLSTHSINERVKEKHEKCMLC